MAYSFWIDSLIALAVAFGATLTAGLTLLLLPFLKQPYRRIEGERTSERPRSFRLGGVVLGAGFLAALAFDERLVWDTALQAFVLGSSAALFLGLIDDFRPLRWWQQLLGQLFLGGVVIQAGMTISRVPLGAGMVLDFSLWPWLPALLTLVWMLVVMNAVNWIDGTDGLLGGVAGIALIVIMLLSLRPEVNQPTLVLLALMLLGAIIGFLGFNWHPAKMLAGSSGALLIGFALGMLSLYAGTKVATVLVVLALPILDFVSVILTRLRHGRSPFLPDRSHLHHILLSLGWSPRGIASIYVAVTVALGVLALSTRHWEKLWVLALAAPLFFGVLAWMQWTLHARLSRN